MSSTGFLAALQPDQQPMSSSSGVIDGDDRELELPGNAGPGIHTNFGAKGTLPPGEERNVRAADEGTRKGGGEPVDFSMYDDVRTSERQIYVKDFETIDWTFYHEKDRERRIAEFGGSRRNAIYKTVFSFYDAMQSWLALSAVGFGCGAIFAMIGAGSDWMTDVKFGICAGRGFWITRSMCCKDSADMLSCPNWRTWAQIMGLGGGENEQVVSYLVYIVIAVAQAGYAAWLCCTFAPYAVSSGIGEIKVIPKP
jgi:hypothetical protein